MTIWKFHVRVDDRVIVSMPRGARILHAGLQRGEIHVWAIVDQDAPLVNRALLVRGTGHPMRGADMFPHVGTVFMGSLVFHVFDAGES